MRKASAIAALASKQEKDFKSAMAAALATKYSHSAVKGVTTAMFERFTEKAIKVNMLCMKSKSLYDGWEAELDCYIVNDDLICDEMEDMVRDGGNLVDYHNCDLFLERWFDAVVVLQTDNSMLYDRLTNRGYMGRKLESNMECEIFQVLLEKAHESYATEIVRALPSNTIEDMSNNVEVLGDWIRAWSPTEMDDS